MQTQRIISRGGNFVGGSLPRIDERGKKPQRKLLIQVSYKENGERKRGQGRPPNTDDLDGELSPDSDEFELDLVDAKIVSKNTASIWKEEEDSRMTDQ